MRNDVRVRVHLSGVDPFLVDMVQVPCVDEQIRYSHPDGVYLLEVNNVRHMVNSPTPSFSPCSTWDAEIFCSIISPRFHLMEAQSDGQAV